MITKKQALEIAKTETQRNLFDSEIEYQVKDAMDCVLNLYGISDYSQYWCIYVHRPENAHIIKSSEVVLVSKRTGEVVYSGLAYDEG